MPTGSAILCPMERNIWGDGPSAPLYDPTNLFVPFGEYPRMPGDGVPPKHLVWNSPPPSSEGFKVPPANVSTGDWEGERRSHMPKQTESLFPQQEPATIDAGLLQKSLNHDGCVFNLPVDMFSASEDENEEGDEDEDLLDQRVQQRQKQQQCQYTAEDLALLYARIPKDDHGNLTSIGSIAHVVGECKPCLFVHTGTGCQSGAHCDFCHFVHKRKTKPRPCKGKRDRYRKLVAKLEKLIEDNPDTWDEHAVELPPSIMSNPSLRNKMMERLRAHAASAKAQQQTAATAVKPSIPRDLIIKCPRDQAVHMNRLDAPHESHVPTPPGFNNAYSPQYLSSGLRQPYMPNASMMTGGYQLPPPGISNQYYQHARPYLSL